MNILSELSKIKGIKKIWYQLSECKILLNAYKKFAVRTILGTYSIKANRYPRVIQLPITYKCNYDCVMCGMRVLANKSDFSVEELKTILSDKLFSKITGVGLNGGEPFLLNNIEEYVETIVEALPRLRHLYIISNGYFTDNILEKSIIIHNICRTHRIKYHLSISVDGIGEMQNTMRGNPKASEKTIDTCLLIKSNPNIYCDDFGLICTITKINVYNLAELDAWAKDNSLKITYNVATIHKRIANEKKYEDFSVFTDKEAQLLASEFFYSKFLENYSDLYFTRYYVTRYQKRVAVCGHKNGTVTLTPDGAISYCATHSNEIGNALKKSAKKIFFANENLRYRAKLHKEYCNSCTHYSDAIDKEFWGLYISEIKRLFNYYL